jgi:hypothetical protein
LGVAHRLVSVAPRPKTVAVGVEVAVPLLLHHLGHSLLDEPVHHGGDAQQALSSVWLGDFHALDRLGLVSAGHQLRADAGPMRFEVATEFVNGHAVNTRRTFVALDPLQGPFEVLFVQNLHHQG